MGHTPHIYLPQPWSQDAVPISPTAAHHLLKVIRREPGATVTYTDGAGQFGEGRLLDGSVVRGREHYVAPPAIDLTMAVAPPHDKDRLRFMVEKLGELEVRRIVFLRTRYGAGRLPDLAKATAWAVGALEQSRGAWLVEIAPAWTEAGELEPGSVWFAERHRRTVAAPPPARLTIAIGPEGGWAPGEIPQGAHRMGLGRTVLRVETAAIIAAGLLLRWPTGNNDPTTGSV